MMNTEISFGPTTFAFGSTLIEILPSETRITRFHPHDEVDDFYQCLFLSNRMLYMLECYPMNAIVVNDGSVGSAPVSRARKAALVEITEPSKFLLAQLVLPVLPEQSVAFFEGESGDLDSIWVCVAGSAIEVWLRFWFHLNGEASDAILRENQASMRVADARMSHSV